MIRKGEVTCHTSRTSVRLLTGVFQEEAAGDLTAGIRKTIGKNEGKEKKQEVSAGCWTGAVSCMKQEKPFVSGKRMAFFSSSIQILQTLVTAIGAGLGAWGVVNLLEGYGNDNPGAKSQGIKQLMAGGGVILIGTQLIPQLSGLFG